jgi:hypothetical protein
MQSNETLEQRVVERTHALETAKREAERANEAKSRFLAAIGHDCCSRCMPRTCSPMRLRSKWRLPGATA